jgi:hypothetical protein
VKEGEEDEDSVDGDEGWGWELNSWVNPHLTYESHNMYNVDYYSVFEISQEKFPSDC